MLFVGFAAKDARSVLTEFVCVSLCLAQDGFQVGQGKDAAVPEERQSFFLACVGFSALSELCVTLKKREERQTAGKHHPALPVSACPPFVVSGGMARHQSQTDKAGNMTFYGLDAHMRAFRQCCVRGEADVRILCVWRNEVVSHERQHCA